MCDGIPIYRQKKRKKGGSGIVPFQSINCRFSEVINGNDNYKKIEEGKEKTQQKTFFYSLIRQDFISAKN